MVNQIWVSPSNSGNWKVKQPQNTKASAITSTKAEAKQIGKQIARHQRLEYIEQGKNGQIMEKNTYPRSRDNFPPRG